MKTLFEPILFVLLLASGLSAQISPFSQLEERQLPGLGTERQVVPTEAGYYQLDDPEELREELRRAAYVGEADKQPDALLQLPAPDGQMHTFRVLRYRLLNDELQAAFPDLLVAEGWDVETPHRRVALNWTIRGFSASVTGGGEGRWYVEPLSKERTDLYQSFYTRNVAPPTDENGNPLDLDHDHVDADEYERLLAGMEDFRAALTKSMTCDLLEYDLAIACTAEYFNAIAGNAPTDPITSADTATVLAEITTAINRINQVFQRDFGIQLRIVNLPFNGQVQLIYAGDTDADPYTNSSRLDMLDENQTNTDAVIGSGNYDIGHVFSTNGGGVASVAVVCNPSRKARGVTGLALPTGDPFYIDFVAHEMGHQCGGRHTFNSTEFNCDQRNPPTAYEPGSGTTIMAYAGICGPVSNIQQNSDAYFHANSIQDINLFLRSGGGQSCSLVAAQNNTEPVVNAVGTTYRIPTNTPFVLDATASDADGDALTYCWEQFNAGDYPVAGPPTGFERGVPLFRSFPPVAESRRFFPMYSTVLNGGGGSPWEVLPQRAWTMRFVVTVRDNGTAGYGCPQQDFVNVEVIETGGQFAVTSPNGGETWMGGSQETVTWNVAGTDDPNGVDCSTVEILLSLDRGQTFTRSLGTFPNTGSATVTAPMVSTPDARIQVRADGNIFYDIGDDNFRIEDVGFLLDGTVTSATTCDGLAPFSYQADLEALNGYTGTVNLSVAGLTNGISATVNPTSVTFFNGGPATATVDVDVTNTGGAPDGDYTFQLVATDGITSSSTALNLEVGGDFPLFQPVDGLFVPNRGGGGQYNLTIEYGAAPGGGNYFVDIEGFSTFAGPSPNTPITYTLPGVTDGEMLDVRIFTSNGEETCTAEVTFGTPAAGGSSLSAPLSEASNCEGRTTNDFIVGFTEGNLTAPATIAVISTPPGVTTTQTSTTVGDEGFVGIDIDGEETLDDGSYVITVEATGANNATETIDLDLVIEPNFVPVNSPANDAILQPGNGPGGNTTLVVNFGPATGAGAGPFSYEITLIFPNGGFLTFNSASGQPLQPNTNYSIGLGQVDDGDTYSIGVTATSGGTTVEGCFNTFTYQSSQLPVEWLSFTARPEGKSAQLNWAVNQDDLHAGFEVQRSRGGAADWEAITYVNALPGTEAVNYAFTDTDVLPGRTYLYRLRQTDIDGGEDFSQVRSVRLAGDASELLVYPNPTDGMLTIQYPLDDWATGAGAAQASMEAAVDGPRFELYNALGQRAAAGVLTGERTTIAVGELPAGTYQLVVRDGGEAPRSVRVVVR